MTDQHPLTDQVIHRELLPKFCYSENDLRTITDWQLEQVIQTWEQCMEEPGTDFQVIRRFDQKLKAMRPIQENN